MKPRPDSESDPAWGVISLHRTQGYARLFRSATRAHAYMTIRICTAEKSKGDEPLIYSRERLIEVALSPVQFAELLTSGSMNDGVPCTIRSVIGRSIGEPPSEYDEIQECADEAAGKAIAEAPGLISQALDLLAREAAKVPRGIAKELYSLLDRARTRAGIDADYWREEITKRGDAVRTKARADLAATVDLFLRQAGFEALRDRVAALLPTLEAQPALPAPDPEDP